MINFNPTVSPAETSAVYALLDIIANPDRAKKHLDAIVAEKQAAADVAKKHLEVISAEKQAAAEARDSANAALKEAEQHRAHADVRMSEVNQKEASVDAAHVVRAKQLADHEAVLSEQQKRISDHERQVMDRESRVDAREKALSAKEKIISDLEAKASTAIADAESHRQYHEAIAERARALLEGGAPRAITLNAETGSLTSKMGGA
jgi:chromosome segregation ATPase